jgi:hypothetical protein
MSETVSAGSTESSVHEVLEPSENGTISVLRKSACCVCENCSVETEEDCSALGGTQTGACGCTPNTCTHCGACCLFGDCYEGVSQGDCEDFGGTFIPDKTCEEVECPPPE